MSDCCGTDTTPTPKKASIACVGCGGKVYRVSKKTLLHHLRYPENADLSTGDFYHCENAKCHIVYFSENGKQYELSHIREVPWSKDQSNSNLVCFCFGLTYEQVKTNARAVNFIKEQTAAGMCECEARNVSGKCCLALLKQLTT